MGQIICVGLFQRVQAIRQSLWRANGRRPPLARQVLAALQRRDEHSSRTVKIWSFIKKMLVQNGLSTCKILGRCLGDGSRISLSHRLAQ
jgi:hypothetical protein